MSWLAGILGRKPPLASAPDRETLDAWLRTGYDHATRADVEEAQRLYRKILEHDPRDADALYFLGLIASNDGREMEAADLFRQAIDVRPDDPAFWYALGMALHDLRRVSEAVDAFRSGLALQPENTTVRNNLAAALIELGRDDEAREEMERVLAAGFESGQLQYNLGNVFRHHARIDQAIAACRRAVELVPNDAHAFTNLLLTLNYSENHDAAALFAEHQRFGARFARPYVEPQTDRAWPRRLRVGYVSPDFRSHVVAFFVEPILAHHDRERFEIFCYYNHRWEDAVTERLRGLVDHWVHCVYMTDAELIERIRADGIDILVDLAGHTGDNRLAVFAAKPAPVQASYLGYPNTTGLPAVDYRITDARADPHGEADRLSVERLLRPWPTYFCYRPPPDCPEVTPLPASAAGRVTFGCFNNLPKVSNAFLDTAARILAAVPGSRLVLKSKPLGIAHVADAVQERFVRAGIDLARVDLRGWEAKVGNHLAAYGSIDIALDTFPYNGATTTCEALWMGVPVVTLTADRHAGRMGSSLLNAVALAELVASNADEYVEKSVALAADLSRLSSLRNGLRTRVRQSPLMDETGFTRALERCYVEVWEKKIKPQGKPATLGEETIARLLREGAELRAAGKKLEAEQAYKQVLLDRPDELEALTGLWDLSYETGNDGAAVEWLRRALAVNDHVARLHYMMGCSVLGEGNAADAAASFRRALELDPSMAKAHNNLGFALEVMGQLQEAGQSYRSAIDLDPGLADALYNLGNIYRQLGDATQAAQYIRQALKVESGRADWKCNLGDVLYHDLQLDAAVQSYSAALAIDPGYARACAGRAQAHQALGFADLAEADFRKALELQPDNPHLRSDRLLSLHYRPQEQPQALFEEHLSWAQRHARGLGGQAVRAQHERRLDRRLNIGYVSPDFKRHSVACFIEPVLAAHDRSKVRVFCYSGVAFPDEVTQRMRALCDEWRDIARVNDDWVAERIRADRIDILVDLAGHTGEGRMLLFAREPAPLQVTWLGYPDTTGLAALDYRLTDAVADPQGMTERFHTEKLVRLASGFLCYGPPAESPEVGELPLLKAGRVTFGCFNNLPKVNLSTIALWAQLLKAAPDARLVLKSFGLSAESARSALRERFSAHGLDPERVELRGPETSFAAHLAKYHEIDIALDVFPYNGATTTCEALWMGVPVVTLAGKTHMSRVGASVLSRIGLADLVADTAEAYVQKALQLAADVDRLRELRAALRERMRSSPLLDAQGFARGLEAAYGEMWEQWCGKQDRSREALRLHIGGEQPRPGWKILNVQPGAHVDYVGDCTDLSQFADGSVDEIYASHVVEHLPYADKLPRTLAEFHRVLTKGGAARISVPDFELLCRMFIDPRHTAEQRIFIMRMIFGGQSDAHDFHYVGLTFEILRQLLSDAGFSKVERVKEFGLFDDTSLIRYAGVAISLNVIAYK